MANTANKQQRKSRRHIQTNLESFVTIHCTGKLPAVNLKKRSRNAKKRYFELFESKIISDFIINRIFQNRSNFKYKWIK